MNKLLILKSSFFLCLATSSLLASPCLMEYADFYIAPSVNSLKFDIPFTDSGSGIDHSANYSLTGLSGIKGGVRAQVFIGSHFFLKGYADYGWIFSGDLSLNDSFNTYSGDTKGNLVDGSIGAGYNFYPTSCWQIAPTLGWSFDQIRAYTKNTKKDGIEDHNQQFKSILAGPYLGFETSYNFNCNWSLLAGYELHLAASRIHVYDENTTTSAHTKYLIGSYAHLGVNYQISECWNAGIDLVGYSYNSYNRTGKVTPTAIGTTYTNRYVQNIQSQTAEIRLFTGYTY